MHERVAASLGITEGGSVPTEMPVSLPVEKAKRHHCRLSLDSLIWDRLVREAVKRRASVTEIVRQRLREAVLGGARDMRWEGPSKLADGGSAQHAADAGTEGPKGITMYEL